jgi:hypothetical protein
MFWWQMAGSEAVTLLLKECLMENALTFIQLITNPHLHVVPSICKGDRHRPHLPYEVAKRYCVDELG